MADFSLRDIGVLAYTQGFTLWVYRTATASLADISGAGFFNRLSDLAAVGDRIMVSASDGAMDLHVAQASEANGVHVVRLSSTGDAP